MTHRDLNDGQLDILVDCYADSSLALDNLPYTRQFEVLYKRFCERTGLPLKRHYVWMALCNLRKAKRLVRKEQ